MRASTLAFADQVSPVILTLLVELFEIVARSQSIRERVPFAMAYAQTRYCETSG
jgi:hypothetical protein